MPAAPRLLEDQPHCVLKSLPEGLSSVSCTYSPQLQTAGAQGSIMGWSQQLLPSLGSSPDVFKLNSKRNSISFLIISSFLGCNCNILSLKVHHRPQC